MSSSRPSGTPSAKPCRTASPTGRSIRAFRWYTPSLSSRSADRTSKRPSSPSAYAGMAYGISAIIEAAIKSAAQRRTGPARFDSACLDGAAFIAWSRSMLQQGSIIEPVGARLAGKDLPAESIALAESRPARPTFRRNDAGIGSPGKKGRNHIAILAPGHGAGRVYQAAAGRQHAPRCREQACLQQRQLVDFGRGLAQPDVRMAPDHTERRARRVQQDAVERHPVPPIAGRTGIARHEFRAQAAALEVLPDAGQALWIDVECDEAREGRLAFGDQRRLAARCGAGVEDFLTGGKIQGKRDALRTQILHRDRALFEPRQIMYVAGRVERDRPRHAGFRAASEARFPQLL